MKITVKTLATVTAAFLCASVLPTISASAVTYTPRTTTSTNTTNSDTMVTTSNTNATAEFAVLMWEDNGDNTVSITGCVPFVSLSVSDYPTNNVFTVFIYKGVLEIPSHINDKPVTAINGVNIGKGLNIRYVKVNKSVTEITENAFDKNVYVMYTNKESKRTVI
jgi:hypothetical protein